MIFYITGMNGPIGFFLFLLLLVEFVEDGFQWFSNDIGQYIHLIILGKLIFLFRLKFRTNPISLFGILEMMIEKTYIDMHIFHTDGLTIRIFEMLDQITQLDGGSSQRIHGRIDGDLFSEI